MAQYPENKGFLIWKNMSEILKDKLRKFDKKTKKTVKISFLLLGILVFSFPQMTVSQEFDRKINKGPIAKASIKAHYNEVFLPEIGPRDARKTMYIMVTAYNSEVGQTDDTPFITAFGTHVRDGIVATNFLPRGAIVRFPDYFGDKEFVVEDRMNSRYYYRMDIWMEEKIEAINFGARFLKMEIL